MRIIYTKHAKERLDMRGISKKLIEKTLFDPDEVIQENEEIKIAQKVVKHRFSLEG
jgi:SOS response regulatory protein OraA/RecX